MTDGHRHSREDLLRFRPEHSSFVGIDSDGCVFDTMELKQKQCFHGLIVSHWNLAPIEAYVRQAAEFVNLYSRHRGQNRFPALLKTFDLLRDRREVLASGVPIPSLDALRSLVDSGIPLSNATLRESAAETRNEELASVLRWSEAVNASIEQTVTRTSPFRWARESLERIARNSDAICVSQTPGEALEREWTDSRLLPLIRLIAGQELGTKTEQLALATAGKYAPDRVLMIGDAPGDRKAAASNGALFYPINPGREAASWERFCREAYDRFLSGAYRGTYENERIGEFEALLPDRPPWENPVIGTTARHRPGRVA